MANLKSAQKRARSSINKTNVNKATKTAVSTYISKFNTALENDQIDEAKELLKIVESKLSKAGSKNIFHPKSASRKVSRLTKKLNTLSA